MRKSIAAATREARARRHLAKHGYCLRKTPPRHWTREHHPVGYMITEPKWNAIIAGEEMDIDGPGTIRDFLMTLDDVEAFVAAEAATKIEESFRGVFNEYLALGGTPFRFLESCAKQVRETA